MPRRKFLIKFFDTVYAPFCQTLVPESREFNLSYVRLAAVLRLVVYFKALCQAESLRRFKRLVKGCDIVSIEIVTYKYDLLDIWVSLVKQPRDAFCPVSPGSLPLCYSLTPSGQGFSEKEDAAGAIPHMFVVLVSYTCTVGSKAISCFCQKLNRFLVHTYDRFFGIIWTAVHLKDVLHQFLTFDGGWGNSFPFFKVTKFLSLYQSTCWGGRKLFRHFTTVPDYWS